MEQDFSDSYNLENNELKFSKKIIYSDNKREYYTLMNIDNEESCYQLYFDVSNEKIPLDTNVRKKFGFDKCGSMLEEAYLLFVYYDCFFHFHKEMIIIKKIFNLHIAYLENRIYDYILFLADNNLNSKHFEWFLSNPHIVDKFINVNYILR